MKIDETDRAVRLSEAQQQKLESRLAGRHQAVLRQGGREAEGVPTRPQRPAKVRRLLPGTPAAPAGLTRGLFGDDSLFAKTLRKTLDERQSAVLDDLNRQRNLLRQQARIGRVLATLDSSVGLEIRQRKQLQKLVVEETNPPKAGGPYDVYVVLYQLAKLPRDRIRPIFHESQWRLMSQQLDMMQGYENMLVKQGVLPLGPEPERWVVPVDSDAPGGTPDPEKRDCARRTS